MREVDFFDSGGSMESSSVPSNPVVPYTLCAQVVCYVHPAVAVGSCGPITSRPDASHASEAPGESPRVLVIHSAASHSGKTTLCRALVRDLPFDTYVKLSRRSPQLVECSLSSGSLVATAGDTSLILRSPRAQGLPPLYDVLLCDGPHSETDAAVRRALAHWEPATRVLVEGNCTVAPVPSLHLFIVTCPRPPACKPNVQSLASAAELLVVNCLPSCSSAEEHAFATLVHGWNPLAAVLSGSLADGRFLVTVEEQILGMFPRLRST